MSPSRRIIHHCTPLAALALAACGGVPDSPSLLLGPDGATTTDDLTLSVTDAATVDADDEVSYSVAWYRDGEVDSGLADQTTVSSALTSKGEEWRAVVTPLSKRDKEGESAEVSITIANTPPVVTVSLAPEVPKTTEAVVASVTSTDADDDAVTNTFKWLRDGADSGITGDTLPADQTAKGEVWTVQVAPFDGDDAGVTAEASVSIDNSIPVAESVSLAPTEATETSTIVATPVGTDEDGDALTWTYTWSVNGSVVDVDGPEITGTHFDKGETVSVSAVPSDGFVEGNAVTADASVVNTAPVVGSARVSPSDIFEASDLTCVGGGWVDVDGDLESYRYAWEVDSSVVANGATLNGASFSKGQTVACVVTPWDGEVEGASLRSDVITVQNTPPAITSVSFDTTSPRTDDTLTATASGVTDDDGDGVSLTFAWKVGSTVVATTSGTDLTSTLDGISYFDKGDSVSVEVTPNDGTADGAVFAVTAVTVANSAPVVTATSISPTPLYTTSTASAGRSYVDPDGDSLTESITWVVDLKTVGTGSTLGSTNFEKGDKVSFTIEVSDGTDTGSATATAVEVANTPPTKPGVDVSPAEPDSDDDLVCTISTASTDVDGDGISYDIEWYLDGDLWTGSTSTTTYTGDTISSRDTAHTDIWHCVVTPNDGDHDGAAGESDPTTVLDCSNRGGGSLTYGNGMGGTYCYNSGDSTATRANKACDSYFGVGSCCIIPSGYNGLQYGECGKGGGTGTIHWHPDSWPSGHCGPEYKPGDLVSPGWCGTITGRFLP